MATWEQRRRGILRTALELERDLFASENLYIDELRLSLTEVQEDLTARLGRITAQPRDDGNFDWERWQTESILSELERSIQFWGNRATGIVRSGSSTADELGGKYPLDILSAGGSEMRLRPRLGNPAMAAFHAYDASLVSGVSDKVRADVTGIIRRASLGGDSVFATLNKIGTVTGKGAFATAFHRGEAIIRTEMGRAYSSADMFTMNQSKLDHPGLKKKWLSIIDGRVRPEHAKAHDQVRELDKPFSVAGENMQHPHDTNGSAWNTINCRCKAVPWDPAWEKLAAPGSSDLGPLAFSDSLAFQSRLRELDGRGIEPKQYRSFEERWGDYDGPTRALAELGDEMRDTPWPTPMNPAYWRTKPSFTADQLAELASSSRMFAAFLQERYGITYTTPMHGEGDLLSATAREKLAQALEMYRALDPAYVVENIRLRYIGAAEPGDLGPHTMGAAGWLGDIQFDPSIIEEFVGRQRDPEGINAPRLSDDVYLESILHEIAHSVSYRYGQPGTPALGTATGQLPREAWADYEIIYTTATMTEGLVEIVESTNAAWSDAILEYRAQLAAGWAEDSPEMLARQAAMDVLEQSVADTEAQLSQLGSDDRFASEYAETTPAEDFAESVALYMLQPEEFKLSHPARYAWFQQWIPQLIGGT